MKDDFVIFMQALMEFEACTVQSEFIEIFGKQQGEALWRDFSGKCSNNTTIFYRTLDGTNRQKFIDYLYYHYRHILVNS